MYKLSSPNFSVHVILSSPTQARFLSLDCIIFPHPLCSIAPPPICLTLHSNFSFSQGFSTSTLMTFWLDNSLLWGVVLCIIGCLIASMAPTHYIPVAPSPQVVTTKNVSGRCHMSPECGGEGLVCAKSPLVEPMAYHIGKSSDQLPL